MLLSFESWWPIWASDRNPYNRKKTKFVNIIDLGRYNAKLGGPDVRYSANDMYDV